MRYRCKKLAYLTQLHLQYASARSVREEKPCLFLITKGKKILVAMCDRCKKVPFSLNFTCTSLQDAVLEKKCLVFLLITISIKIFGRDARPL